MASAPERSRAELLVFLVPALGFAGLLGLRTAAGPHYLGPHIDPAYAYLFNGLRVAMGEPAHHMDHPGVTVHLLFGALIRLVSSGRQSLAADVVNAPEDILFAAVVMLSLITFMALSLLGVIAARRASLGAVLATQFLVLSSMAALAHAQLAKPEALQVALVAVVWSALLWKPMHTDGAQPRPEPWGQSVAIGVALALLFCTKMSAIGLLPLIALGARGRALGWRVATFLGGGAVLLLQPFSTPGRFFGFAKNLATFEGYNKPMVGSETMTAKLVEGTQDVGLQLLSEPAVLLLVVVVVAACVARLRQDQRDQDAWVLLMTLAASLASVVASPIDREHYLLPLSCALGAMPLWLGFLEHERVRTRAALVVTLAALLFVQAWGRTYVRVSARPTERAALGSLEGIEACQGLPTLLGYRVSSEAFALRFGDEWGGHIAADVVGQVTPGVFVVFPGWALVMNAQGDRAEVATYLETHGPACVHYWLREPARKGWGPGVVEVPLLKSEHEQVSILRFVGPPSP